MEQNTVNQDKTINKMIDIYTANLSINVDDTNYTYKQLNAFDRRVVDLNIIKQLITTNLFPGLYDIYGETTGYKKMYQIIENRFYKHIKQGLKKSKTHMISRIIPIDKIR